MLELFKLDDSNIFPSTNFALDEPNGLLAFGGDLSVERLVSAYRSGIFPWFGEHDPYLWWSPNPRTILELNNFHASRSLRKTLRKSEYEITLNNNFIDVINLCSKIPRKSLAAGQTQEMSEQTWITQEMIAAYIKLHEAKHAHSVEVWYQQQLVGGLYGISVGGVFCGESMFHSKTDASKAALLALVRYMKTFDMGFIDCQMETPHLTSLGCETVNRNEFIKRLKQQKDRKFANDLWRPQSLSALV